MHTGVISFCDRICYNIKSLETKDVILDHIHKRYSIQVLQRHWFHLDDKGYDHLKRTPHLTCLRSNGNPYYMYFSRYEDTSIIYYIDKKVQPCYQKPRIILGRGMWDDKLFDGTILDGEMVKMSHNVTSGANSWIFLIHDVIAYKGRYLQNETLPQRLEHAFELLDALHTLDDVMDCCAFQVKQYAHATQEGVNALIDLSKELPYTTRGIYFCPFSLKYKPKLVNFDDSLIKTVVRKVKDVPDFRESTQNDTTLNKDIEVPPPQSIKSVSVSANATLENNQSASPTHTKCWLRKTENPDVYDVHKNEENSRGARIGTASIPSMKTSKMMRAVFKDATVAMYIPFMCEYVSSSEKWLPIAICT